MGTKVHPDDPVWGDDCSIIQPYSNTPESIYLYFWDIEICPARPVCPYNNKLVHLRQDSVNPCRFDYANAATNWNAALWYQAGLPRTNLYLRYDGAEYYFIGTMPGVAFENQILTNNIVACAAHNWGKNGSVLFLWKQEAADLIDGLGLDFSSQIFLEVFIADGDVVYKFTNSRREFNIRVRMS